MLHHFLDLRLVLSVVVETLHLGKVWVANSQWVVGSDRPHLPSHGFHARVPHAWLQSLRSQILAVLRFANCSCDIS